MKMRLVSVSIALGLMFSASVAVAAGMEPYVGGKQFEKMKTLAGSWQGHANGNKNETVSVNYKVSSAGSSIVETHFPGKPQEMVSVYTEVNGKIHMTHYCAMKNQPSLLLKKTTADTLVFDYLDGVNLDVKKDMHMHGLTLKFIAKNELQQHWVQYQGGKSVGINVISLQRVSD